MRICSAEFDSDQTRGAVGGSQRDLDTNDTKILQQGRGDVANALGPPQRDAGKPGPATSSQVDCVAQSELNGFLHTRSGATPQPTPGPPLRARRRALPAFDAGTGCAFEALMVQHAGLERRRGPAGLAFFVDVVAAFCCSWLGPMVQRP